MGQNPTEDEVGLFLQDEIQGSKAWWSRIKNYRRFIKVIDRPFEGTVELEARQIFLSYFKGASSQDQQKTIRRRLITTEEILEKFFLRQICPFFKP
jgi:hypothetical protein